MSITGGLYSNPPRGKVSELSGSTPEPVGISADIGTSEEAARADHVHALGTEVLAQIESAAFAMAAVMGGY